MNAFLGFLALSLVTVGLIMWLPFWLVLALLLALYLWLEWLPKPDENEPLRKR